jgi:hypothetical protein
MMFFSRIKAAGSLRSQANGKESAVASHRGDANHSAPHQSGEASFKAHHCALWNDVARALDSKPRGAK